jgi:hypothetical protein
MFFLETDPSSLLDGKWDGIIPIVLLIALLVGWRLLSREK